MPVAARDLLRAGLLDGVSVAVAGARGSDAEPASVSSAVIAATAELGAAVAVVALAPGLDAERAEHAAEAAVGEARASLGALSALVVDGASLFSDGARDGLIGCLSASWNAVRASATEAFLPDASAGRVVLLAPSAGAEHAGPAAAGLENLARTLSIEWARYAITTVAVAPAASTSVTELATLVAYLLSPAGAYFSGCLMDLRGPTAAG